jgi:hypothetical protein
MEAICPGHERPNINNPCQACKQEPMTRIAVLRKNPLNAVTWRKWNNGKKSTRNTEPCLRIARERNRDQPTRPSPQAIASVGKKDAENQESDNETACMTQEQWTAQTKQAL